MRQMPDPYAGKKKLLVIADVQSGFHHDSINHAMAVVERLGRESGAYVSFLRTDSQLVTKQPLVGRGARYTGRPINAHNLDYFDAIFFLGSGEGTLSAQQKADLLAFVHEDGKGFVAAHAATIAYFDWPEYGEMIGGVMDGEWPIEPTALIIADPKFPGAANFPVTFADQYPYLKAPYARGKVHTIIRLNPARLKPEQRAKRPDGDVPVVWAKSYGKGRVFSSSFGHRDEVWDDPAVQKLYLEGIKWALGLTHADVTPDHP
ncbi:MAG: ThuA domain-containing protein [Caulobacter sp.]|nr:ThuA domain-containing protein [Caulobacter sp.]